MSPIDRILVTGGAGFVGSHLVRHLLTETDAHLVLPVTFRHRGDSQRIEVATGDHPEWAARMTILQHDLRGPFSRVAIRQMGPIDAIVNVASESHVDRSIIDPVGFIENNVSLVLNVLELARAVEPSIFVQISTDEVYGPAPDGHNHAEWEAIKPSNPYSASKACQEAIAFSYWRTYGVPLVVTNTMNIVGETQDVEKFVPMLIRASLDGSIVTIHGDVAGRPGSRFYLHARNQADALLFILRNVSPVRYPQSELPHRFNVVGEQEIDNVTLARMVDAAVRRACPGAPGLQVKLVDFHSSRPGHDLRYALDGAKLASLGWKAPVPLVESLERTVRWSIDHPEWL